MPNAVPAPTDETLSQGAVRQRRLAYVAIALMVAAAIGGAGAVMAAPGDGSGSPLAFGWNVYGQLGIATNSGTGNPNPTPTLVTLPGQNGTVTQLAVGYAHSLALTSSSQLYGFGYNANGQLGNATNNGTGTPNPTPTVATLPGQIGTISQIAAGSFHSLAVTSSGQLYSFGSNVDGQLGIAASSGTGTPVFTPTLVTLPGEIGTVTQSAGGGAHSLVVTSSGQLYAFGINEHGQLGNATNTGPGATANPTPTLVGLPGQVGPVTQIAAGVNHSLALTASGQLYAFGGNTSGQLGNTTNNGIDTANPTPAPVTLPGQVGQVTQIAAGNGYSMVATSSGQLYAFGLNQYGQLGNATNNTTTVANPTPTPVTLPGQVGPVTQISAGEANSLAVTSSGQLYGFGLNYYGELGSATSNGTTNPNPTPALVAFAPGTTIDTVAKGPQSYHGLALVGNLAIATTALPSAQVGTPYQLAVQAAGGTAPMSWSAQGLPAGLAIDPASGAISGTPTAAGGFSPKVTLTDRYGLTVSNTLALTVATATGAPPPAAAKPPKLTALKQSASKWLLGTKLAQLTSTIKPPVKKAGIPVGTTFTFTLDQAARVTLTFRHTAIGRRVAGKCVARTPGNANKPRCTRTVTDGALRIQARIGTNNLRFEGRISRLVKLKPRGYTVAITATSTAGKKSAPKTLRFTIVTS